MSPDGLHSGDQSLPKKEKLKSRKSIKALFEQGRVMSIPPIRITYLIARNYPEMAIPQFSVSVSKRNFPKATQRNRIKRLLREVYRINKSPLKEACVTYNTSLEMMWIYTSKEPADFIKLDSTAKGLISKLIKKVSQTSSIKV